MAVSQGIDLILEARGYRSWIEWLLDLFSRGGPYSGLMNLSSCVVFCACRLSSKMRFSAVIKMAK